MSCISIFIDESGTFSPYDHKDAYYLVSLVFHDQSIDIFDSIRLLDREIDLLEISPRVIHTAPLVRREFDYKNIEIKLRKKIFNILFSFFRHIDITYKCITVEKKQTATEIELVSQISKQLSRFLRENFAQFSIYDEIKIYYDNGQNQLTKILVSVFSSVLDNVTFKKIIPADYKLAQVADLCCTLELLSLKVEAKTTTKSESYFFSSIKQLKKSYLRPLRGKVFCDKF
jgi:hypothetical protein